MLSALILFADDVKKEAESAPPEGIGGLLSSPMLIPIILMALFFFVVILPAQRKQKREAESLLANMKKNDEVVTASGIIGVIAHIKDGGDEVTLKVDDNARIRVLKSSIVRILKKEEPKEGASPPATTDKPSV